MTELETELQSMVDRGLIGSFKIKDDYIYFCPVKAVPYIKLDFVATANNIEFKQVTQ